MGIPFEAFVVMERFWVMFYEWVYMMWWVVWLAYLLEIPGCCINTSKGYEYGNGVEEHVQQMKLPSLDVFFLR